MILLGVSRTVKVCFYCIQSMKRLIYCILCYLILSLHFELSLPLTFYYRLHIQTFIIIPDVLSSRLWSASQVNSVAFQVCYKTHPALLCLQFSNSSLFFWLLFCPVLLEVAALRKNGKPLSCLWESSASNGINFELLGGDSHVFPLNPLNKNVNPLLYFMFTW